jgi:DNA-binding NarL/FixJ family response regulator
MMFVRQCCTDKIIEVHDTITFYEAVAARHPRLALLETSCWFELTAYEIALCCAKYPQMSIAVFCNERMTPSQAAGFINLGVASFVDMRIENEAEIAASFRAIVEEKTYIPKWVSAATEKYRCVLPECAALQKKEFAVLRLIALGNTVDDIASKLDIKNGTVRNHITSILQKTGAHRQIELLPLALKLRAVNPDELIAAEFAVIEYF